MKRYLIINLACVSPMIHDLEHLFKYLFATHTSSLDILGGLFTCLLKLQKRLSLIT